MSTPISGFASETEYRRFRKNAIKLTSFLSNNGCEVFSELKNVTSTGDYNSPANSVSEDFNRIKSNECFLLLHPAKMQTSSLIEFGYACALNKQIVVVGKKEDLPYLVIGYEEYSNRAKIVEVDKLSEEVFPSILSALQSVT